MADALLAVVLALAGGAYAHGRGRRLVARQAGSTVTAQRRGAAAAMVAGLLCVCAALASPLDAAADRSFSAHMLQHLLLLSVAAPLLALGRPTREILWALPPRWRRAGLRRWAAVVGSQRGGRWVGWVVATVGLQTAVVWAWHAPVAYQAALRSPWWHGAEHACFLATSTIQWMVLTESRRWRRGAAALAVFVAAFPGTALGAALLLAPGPWYPVYGHGDAALADQQLAGVVMWGFGGILYVVAAAALFATWLATGPVSATPAAPPLVLAHPQPKSGPR